MSARVARSISGAIAPCPYCARPMTVMQRGGGFPGPYAATRDHILPRERGGTLATGNVRICCWSCNRLRGQLGHCVGALACFLACMDDGPLPWRATAAAWRKSSPLFERLPR